MIAREGAAPVLVAAVTGGSLCYAGDWVAGGGALALGGLLAWVFLDTPRRLPDAPLDVVSPVDGVVTEVARGVHGWFEGDSLRVRIDVRWPGVKVLRAPTEGQVQDVRTGRRDEGQGSPDDYAVQLRTDEGDDVVYVVRSDWPVSRFRSYAAIGERLGHGRRCGFVYFASCAELLLPATCDGCVTVGERVRGGVTTLARLPDHRRG